MTMPSDSPVNVDNCSIVCHAAPVSLEQLSIDTHGLAVDDDSVTMVHAMWTGKQGLVVNV